MFSALMASIFQVFIPVAITAYLLIGWMLYSGKLEPFGDRKDLDAKLKALKKTRKEKKEKETNFALKKWMTFGGGFYGTAAFYTYIAIELKEVFTFIGKVLDPANWHFSITLELFINFFINSIMNFVSALLWFQYWDSGDRNDIWINFITAYLGYMVGTKLANIHLAEDVGHPQLWRWLKSWRGRRTQARAEAESD
ncbi:hypothetical protein [Kordiimonas aestuarii]|uniref:hypothetical protein n=1 Tax=Kordiimonas aestuarii TaxID=1005925 RepID=UPI0021D112BC|nr:hypothetical protein [Kordiimonas aestuarii]